MPQTFMYYYILFIYIYIYLRKGLRLFMCNEYRAKKQLNLVNVAFDDGTTMVRHSGHTFALKMPGNLHIFLLLLLLLSLFFGDINRFTVLRGEMGLFCHQSSAGVRWFCDK